MWAIIKDYLIEVFIKIVMGYLIFLPLAILAISSLLFIFTEWDEAIATLISVYKHSLFPYLMWFPFVFPWFSRLKGSDPYEDMSIADRQWLHGW